ncbi:hypothetical protein [Clostridium beijerinckii]|jgi:hypothetical protein|uniref:Uncharacterized protein n=1 Tax=Clostridium beijerinckii TaxID=1520 RepID=A0AAE2RMZ4_CLOBE|nr:hypothetical protein [Clostridium beijerinckii]MBF7808243.1 hypothetical protein [Clostridium beijerinckii]NRT21810.1 hypothetical protein [Clostridium beijerinckii]NRT65684.1 hypothetical protein [Clostridium beijerinckii]NRT82803.1 hypothetical protein [Clostridium beijerinckii]NRU52749.1 hypothetical protein [Clostridium beijerinckii]
MDKTTAKSIQIMKDPVTQKDIKIKIIDEHNYYDLTNEVGYKVIKQY